jgi:glycosyltransferase involved in cell wall biosynthesis
VVEVVHQHKKITNAQFYVYNTEYTRRQNGAEGDPKSMVILPPPCSDAAINTSQPGTMIGFVKPLPGKGVDFFYQIVDAFPDRQFLVLRGEWQACETIIEKPNIKFIDPVEHMSEFYNQCRIVLMPSLSEDAGTIPVEAAYNGIPCISSNVMGLPETNAGGILLPLELCLWIGAVVGLDDPHRYFSLVNLQRVFVSGNNWSAKFDQLSETLEKL